MDKTTSYLLLSILFILLIHNPVLAQQIADSLPKPVESPVPVYPRIKLLSVSYDQSASTDYKVKTTGNPDNEGDMSRGRLQVVANIPIWKKNAFALSVTEVYTHEEMAIKQSRNPIFESQANYSFDNFITTLNASYLGKLFNKPLLTNASVIVGSADFLHPEKVSGLVTAMLVFQKRPDTRYTLGLGGLIDPSSQIPAFPIITYWHRFKDPRWELDIILPTMLKIRRSDVWGGWLSAGSDFNGFGYFITDAPNTSKTYQNTYSEISFNVSYEKIFAKNFMVSLQGGYKSTLQNRIMEVNKKYNDAIADIDMGSAPYFKVGMSYIIPNEQVKKEIQRIEAERKTKNSPTGQ